MQEDDKAPVSEDTSLSPEDTQVDEGASATEEENVDDVTSEDGGQEEESLEDQEAPVEPPEEDNTQPDRVKNAIEKVEKANSEVRQAVALQAEMVEENPQLIHKIAASNPQMANRVIEKVWGDQGVKTYKQLMEHVELEQLKEDDPDAYKAQKEHLQTKQRLETLEARDRNRAEAKFLESRGIRNNEYDENYQRLHEALDSINPKIVSEDYEKALELAYNIAFSKGSAPKPTTPPPPLNVGGGHVTPSVPPNKPRLSEDEQWLVKGLNEKRGYNIKL